MSSTANRLRYVRRETLVSALINAVISVGFFLIVFGLSAPVPVWGLGNYVFDFLPQGFAVSFFGSLVPAQMAARALPKEAVASGIDPAPSFAASLGNSVVKGAAAGLAGTLLFAALFWLFGLQELATGPALAIKLSYGALLGGSVTWLTLTRLLVAR
ncbi:MAG TPA: hypothetical protein VLA37_12860 [Sphingomonadaceae bacterium]|nr:hypothetical protein [Sphingomonadaceae bacterium]